MTFRVFTNDVDGGRGYSCFASWRGTQERAQQYAAKLAAKFQCKVAMLPEDRRDLWPDGQTGRLPIAAKAFVVGGAK